jgi:hypothetical protein
MKVHDTCPRTAFTNWHTPNPPSEREPSQIAWAAVPGISFLSKHPCHAEEFGEQAVFLEYLENKPWPLDSSQSFLWIMFRRVLQYDFFYCIQLLVQEIPMSLLTTLEHFRRMVALDPVTRAVVEDRLTYLSVGKLRRLQRALKETGKVEGDILEFGVALGGSGIIFALNLGKSRRFLGFDVFQMIPPLHRTRMTPSPRLAMNRSNPALAKELEGTNITAIGKISLQRSRLLLRAMMLRSTDTGLFSTAAFSKKPGQPCPSVLSRWLI